MPFVKPISKIECCLETLRDEFDAAQDSFRFGNATLVGGTIAVADTKVTATSYVLLTRKTLSTAGVLTYTLTAGTGITINSNSGTDVGVITYQIVY